jgi:7-cyano-7-deazaguanine synthase
MPTQTDTQTVGVLLSGGLDSGILLAHLLDAGRIVRPFYIRSHLVWEPHELAAVQQFLRALTCDHLKALVTLELPLGDLYEEHWSVTGRNTPDAVSPDEAVFLPGRNALLIVKAAVWCQLNNIAELALASLGTNPFPDATAAFFENFEAALNQGVARPLRIIRPFGHMSKCEVMHLGRRYPLEYTFSCISPQDGSHCGECNKCAERRAAFRAADMRDPTRYSSSTEARESPRR